VRIPLKRLKDQVIVITGASSGIGLTTAEMAVARGARVVLAARSDEELRETTERLNRGGRKAAFVVADVADEEAVQAVARRAIAEFGGFDTWVNNAGVSVYGRLIDVPMADKRRVFETNFWGVVYGCKAAVRHLRGRGGAIINIGSVLSEFSVPLQGIYSASKHAVKGYTDALRMELELDSAPIAVTLVKPGSIDTPYPQHARSYMAREPKQQPPVYRPEDVAHAILRCAERPMREVVVGGGSRAMIAIAKAAPRLTDLYMERTMVSGQQRDLPPNSDDDSLYKPSHDRRRRGDHPGYVMKSSAYTRAVVSDARRALPFVAVGAIFVAGVAAAARRRRISFEGVRA
jgi:NAD(P)-dependent dehydrogenase (short-subunit alcohol dehydrogenase family)